MTKQYEMFSHWIPPFLDKETKSCYPKQESIPCRSLSRRACWLALEASGIEPVPLAFKASGISTAPLVLYYPSTVSRIWPGSWMGINPLYLSKHIMLTHEKKNPIKSMYNNPKSAQCEVKRARIRLDKNCQ